MAQQEDDYTRVESPAEIETLLQTLIEPGVPMRRPCCHRSGRFQS